MAVIQKKQALTIDVVVNWIMLLTIFSVIACIGNYVGQETPILEALPGMFILAGITLAGLLLERIIPINFPAIGYISIIGILVAIPASPISGFVAEYTAKINLLSICTVILAYSGIAIGKSWDEFKKMGWRGIVVTVVVIFGTYMGSALIAQFILTMQGII